MNDREDAAVPVGLRVIDAHVHLFPDRVFAAIWRWFDEHAWPIRYRLTADQVVEFLVARGVERIVGLAYSHRPGMAESLNAFMAGLASRHRAVIGCGTVLPGEPGARQIVARALGAENLAGIKIHCHVQCVAPDDPRMDVVYEEATAAEKPVIIHAGREPASGAYMCDPRALCSAAAVGRALERHPRLKMVVPHLGADEFEEFDALLDVYPGLTLDTTMVCADYFATSPDPELLQRRSARLIYGSDFPNLPYAWDREVKRIAAAPLSANARDDILFRNAARLFGVTDQSSSCQE